jgi:hypothetical protein
MEGLAISPDGSTLFGIMQSALLQDHGLNPGTTDRLGLNNRILKIDLATNQTHEYVYVLEAINRGQGVSEILAINDHEFLVVERDNRSNLQTPPAAPTRKKIYKIDLSGATCIRNRVYRRVLCRQVQQSASRSSSICWMGIEPGSDDCKKIEGLAWGRSAGWAASFTWSATTI